MNDLMPGNIGSIFELKILSGPQRYTSILGSELMAKLSKLLYC